MKKLVSLPLLFLLLFTGACKKDNNPAPATPQPAKELRNVAYGPHLLQQMDVLFPEGYTRETPVVFLIHGGGFAAGVKEDFEMQAQLFRQEGFVVANLSHRLIDTTGLLSLPPTHQPSDIKVSDELADVHAAVEKFVAAADGWGLGAGKMYMAGHSAGAILSMLYVQGDYNVDGHIRASGNWAGITDLSIPHDSLLTSIDPRWLELMYRATGAMPSTATNLYLMAISPTWVGFNHAGHANISIFPQYNGILGLPDEDAFQLQRTQDFHTLLHNKGAAEKLSVYEGEDHGFGTKPGSWNNLIHETALFFRAH